MAESSQETETHKVIAADWEDGQQTSLVDTCSRVSSGGRISTISHETEMPSAECPETPHIVPQLGSSQTCLHVATEEQVSEHVHETVSMDALEAVSSPGHVQQKIESCDSHHHAVNESVFIQSIDCSEHTDQDTDNQETQVEAKCGIDTEGFVSIHSDSVKLFDSGHSEMALDEIPSTQVHIHQSGGVEGSTDHSVEDMNTENLQDTESSHSVQNITEPEGNTAELENQPEPICVNAKQYELSLELPSHEQSQIWQNKNLAKEEGSDSTPPCKISSETVACTDDTHDTVTEAVISDNTDTNSNQDLIKDDAIQAKPYATLDANTDASGRSTPNIEFFKDFTGRDSPSVRSLKDDSGRDSPSQRSRRRIGRDSVVTEANEQNLGNFPAENLFEYQWPQEKGAEWYFVQEQISEFLQVKSFKRKYPDLERRVMDINEKDFLRERGVVTEEQVTLGLTALRADEVYDLMLKDAPDKSAEYARVLHEKEKQNISNKHKQYEAPSVDSSKVQEYIKKAVRQAADYNSALMAERREERLYYFDMQTLTVQMPASRMKRQDCESTKLGPYPVAVIPGQYQNYYRSYSSEELKYFPLNTSLYGPVAPRRQTDLAPPPTRDEPEPLSDNETIGSTDNLDSSSDGSDGNHDVPMGVGADNMELLSDDTTANVTLSSQQPSCVYKPVAVADMEPCVVLDLEQPKDIPDAICGLCLKDSSQNKMGVPEKMIHCSQCDNSGHPSCLEMSSSMVEVIQTYPWQCMECKTCFHCGDPTHEDKMMFCDMCDRGYHTFCVGLQDIPTGLWACESCQTSDAPAALAPHVATPPLPPTPPPAEHTPQEDSSRQTPEVAPADKKKARKQTTPGSAPRQSTPASKRSKASTPTPKRIKKK